MSYVIFKEDKMGYPLGTSEESEGSFNVYVIDGGNNNRIDFGVGRVTKLDVSRPIKLDGDVSNIGVAGGRVYITVSFQGGLVAETVVDITDGKFEYQIDPYNINSAFQNYAINDPNDRLDITAFVMGLTETGKVRFAADRLYTYGPYIYSTNTEYEEIRPEASRERGQETKPEERLDTFRRKRGAL